MKDYGSMILVKRRNSGITQIDLSKHLNINVQTLIDIEKGLLDIGEGAYKQISDGIDELTKTTERKLREAKQ